MNQSIVSNFAIRKLCAILVALFSPVGILFDSNSGSLYAKYFPYDFPDWKIPRKRFQIKKEIIVVQTYNIYTVFYLYMHIYIERYEVGGLYNEQHSTNFLWSYLAGVHSFFLSFIPLLTLLLCSL